MAIQPTPAKVARTSSSSSVSDDINNVQIPPSSLTVAQKHIHESCPSKSNFHGDDLRSNYNSDMRQIATTTKQTTVNSDYEKESLKRKLPRTNCSQQMKVDSKVLSNLEDDIQQV